MATPPPAPQSDSHRYVDLVAADRGIFRKLHCQELTGFTIPPPAFNPNLILDTLVVNLSTTLHGVVNIDCPTFITNTLEVDDLHVTNDGLFDGDIVANNIRAIFILRGGTGIIDGTLTVGTNATINGALSVPTGPTTLGGTTTATTLNATTLTVSGLTTTTDLTVTGSATITLLSLTTLNVSGTTTTGALVTNSATVNGPATVTGNLQANTITAVVSLTTPSLNATNITAQNIIAPGTITMLGTVNLGTTTATSLVVSGPLTANSGAFGTITVSGLASLNGGATIPAGQVLTLNNATLNGTGTAAIVMQGNITSTAGQVTAPVASLPAIINVSTINGLPYPPPAGGLPLDVVFNNCTVNVAFVSNGTAQFNGLTVPTGNVSITNNLGVTGTTTTGNLVVSGTSTLATVTATTINASVAVNAPTANLPAITGVLTINGQPYPPPSSALSFPRGQPIAIANNAWNPLTIPAGGYGEYSIEASTIAGTNNNCLNPADPAFDPVFTAPRITSVAGPGAGSLLEFGLTNNTQFLFILPDGPLTHLPDSAGQVLFPGTRARFTRRTTADPWRYVSTTPMRWNSYRVASSNSSLSLPSIIQSYNNTDFELQAAVVEYSWSGTSHPTLTHMGLHLDLTYHFILRSYVVPSNSGALIQFTLPCGRNPAGWPDLPTTPPYSKGYRPPWGYMPDVFWEDATTGTLASSQDINALPLGINVLPTSDTRTTTRPIQTIVSGSLGIRIFETTADITSSGNNVMRQTGRLRVQLPKYLYRASF